MNKKIFIASFLKPVNDVRSYSKIAASLSNLDNYNIYCTGYPSKIGATHQNIRLLPLRKFNKNGFSRWLARWQILNLYIKVKPELIIVNSPDLLLLTSLYKIIFGSKIVYDIQENYLYNLWYQENYPKAIKYLFGINIRIKEIITAPLFDLFFIAEKVYSTQLHFIKNKYVLLENKALPTTVSKNKGAKNDVFIISGTIAEAYGVWEGLEFYLCYHRQNPNSKLSIIGHCPSPKLRAKLKSACTKHQSIELTISQYPISNTLIQSKIKQATFGLLPYKYNKSTAGKMPTKLYEYAAHHVPYIIQKSNQWQHFIDSTGSGVAFDFGAITNNTTSKVVSTLKQLKRSLNPDNLIYWAAEEPKLLKEVSNLIP